MSTTVFRQLAQQREPKPEKDPKQCGAYGCPCRSTVNLGGNGWACSFHAFAEVDMWQYITRGLRDHDWLIGLINDIRKMDAAHQDWRSFSSQFWVNSDTHCMPHPQENASPYADRMVYELLWRVGQRKGRPEPRIPQAVKPSGRFALSLGAA